MTASGTVKRPSSGSWIIGPDRAELVRRVMHVEVCRVYGHNDTGDAYRVLVDRLWPRGVSKADAALDEWAKDVAPTAELRRWYNHEPARFDEFARRYRGELSREPAREVVMQLRSLARGRKVVLLTATRDVGRSGAQVLVDVLTGSKNR
jgi:uncharacterized protein YeaO (DUF488 family)